MTVLVAMTYWRCPQYVERAVQSVLAQTHTDLQLLVIGDGDDVPRLPSDPRLVTYELPVNRGTYFGHALALAASPHDWYAPVDADDYVEPDHLAQLLAVGTDSVVSQVIFHGNDGRLRHPKGTYWVGVHRTQRLRSFGGLNPAERMGQDGLTQRLLRLTGPVSTAPQRTYHRIKRPGSLTTAPRTRIRSPQRLAMIERNDRIMAECHALAPDVEAIRRYRLSLVPHNVADALAHHARELGDLLRATAQVAA